MCDTRQYLHMNAGGNTKEVSTSQITAKYPSALSNQLKMLHFTVNSFHNHTWKSDCSNALMSQQVNVEKNQNQFFYGTMLQR